MAFENVSAKIDNRFGLLNIAQLQGKSDGGLISLPGTLDARKGEPRAVFHPRLEGVEIGTILKAFDYPIAREIFPARILTPRRFVTAGKGRPMSK